jgi:hypothetical protein
VQARRLRRSRIQNLHDDYKARLEKFRQAIERQDWHKAAAVRNQCQSMEQTVYAILEGHYFLEVLDQETPPTKPNWKAMGFHPKPPVALPEGEEILGSDDDIDTLTLSDSSSAEDDDIAEDIPFAPEVAVNPVPHTAPKKHGEPPASLPTKHDPPQARELSIKHRSVEESGADADAESDAGNKIVSLARRQHWSPLSMSSANSKNFLTVGNKEPIRPPNYSLESGSHTDRPKLPDTKYKGLGYSKSRAIDLTFSDSDEQEKEATSSECLEPSMASSRKPITRTYDSRILRSPFRKNSPFAGADCLAAIKDVKGMRKLVCQVPPDRVRTLLSIQEAAKRGTKRNAEEAERQDFACDDSRDLITTEEAMQSQPHKKQRQYVVLDL